MKEPLQKRQRRTCVDFPLIVVEPARHQSKELRVNVDVLVRLLHEIPSLCVILAAIRLAFTKPSVVRLSDVETAALRNASPAYLIANPSQ